MFCCSASFSLDDDPAAPTSPKFFKKKPTRNKNRFSTRGLDKFSKVMAELKAKRHQILATTGSPAASIVLFVYHNTRDWTPIIVHLPESPTKKSHAKKANVTNQPPPLPLPSPKHQIAKRVDKAGERKVKKSFSWGVKERGRESSYYMAGVMMVILLCVVMFGRMFAICCTSISWYLVPTMIGGDDDMSIKMSSMKNKRVSGKRLSGVGRKPELRMLELRSPRSQGSKG